MDVVDFLASRLTIIDAHDKRYRIVLLGALQIARLHRSIDGFDIETVGNQRRYQRFADESLALRALTTAILEIEPP